MPINLLFEEPVMFLIWIMAIIVGISIHEFSHAWAGTLAGDNTAKMMGRLTLNPLAHLDPLGTIMLLFVGFGWGKPVPFNPYNLKNKRWGPAFISIAGPLSNFVAIIGFGLAIKFLLIFNVVAPENLLIQFFFLIIIVNIVLMVFNLLPIPPLDGSKVLFAVLPDKYYDFKLKLQQNGPWIILGLIFIDWILPISIFGYLFSGIINLVYKFF